MISLMTRRRSPIGPNTFGPRDRRLFNAAEIVCTETPIDNAAARIDPLICTIRSSRRITSGYVSCVTTSSRFFHATRSPGCPIGRR